MIASVWFVSTIILLILIWFIFRKKDISKRMLIAFIAFSIIMQMYSYEIVSDFSILSNHWYYAYGFFIVLILIYLCMIYFIYRNIRLYQALNRNWDKIIYIGLIMMMLLFMIKFSTLESFWQDEIYQLTICEECDSVFEVIKKYTTADAAPPLFAVISYVWYDIVPYGQKWLLLLCEIMVCIGIYFVALSGKLIKGKTMGIFSCIIAVTSGILVLGCGYEFRQYALLFLTSAITLYLYIVRIRNKEKKSWALLVLYGIFIALLVYSFYLAVIICLGFFMVDIYLIIKKKIKPVSIISYFIGGALFLPWAAARYLALKNIGVGVLPNSFWPEKPDPESIKHVLYYINSGDVTSILLFTGGAALIITLIVLQCFRRKNFNEEHIICFSFLWIPFFYSAIIYIYSTIINPSASLWVDRYFLCLLPYAILISAYGLTYFSNIMANAISNDNKAIKRIAVVFFLSLFLLTYFGINAAGNVIYDQKQKRDPFREAADWLVEETKITSNDVAVYVCKPNNQSMAWNEYYVSKKGKREKIKNLNPSDISNKGYKKIYVFQPVLAYEEPFESIKEGLEKNGYEIEEYNEEVNITVFTKD